MTCASVSPAIFGAVPRVVVGREGVLRAVAIHDGELGAGLDGRTHVELEAFDDNGRLRPTTVAAGRFGSVVVIVVAAARREPEGEDSREGDHSQALGHSGDHALDYGRGGGEGSRGRPALAAATTLRWISFVPAQMDEAW